MTVVVGAPYAAAGTVVTHSVAVPAGVTPDMTGVLVFNTCTNEPVTLTSATAAGASPVVTKLDARAANNSYIGLFTMTGLTAGQTITLTLSTRSQIFLHHIYQDEYTVSAARMGVAIRSGSSTVSHSGSVTPTAGATVLLVAVERTLTDGTAVTALSSSGGEAVRKIAFAEDVNNPDGSVLFASFTASSGTARTASVTYNLGSGNGYAALLATTPKTSTPPVTPPPGGAQITFTTNANAVVSGRAYIVGASGALTAPAEVRAVPHGYASVTAMLAAKPFYVAHRGGSLDWPEMSLYAYTQSANWGVGAVEVSLDRTSDGVWFGLHDSTLDRTSGTSGYTAAQHTWAEISKYTITAAATKTPSQPRRPYMRWEELIAAYYGTHVIFIDPKYAVSHASELLAMMDALPGTPTASLVAKYYGVTTGWPQSARAHGYKTWGYFYQADVPNLAKYAGYWDILGMDYTADAASWTAIMKYGKPVIGHILPSRSAMNTAVSRGAVGGMVSGVKETITRSA
ncbi:glycerophosphodiester phosphodiesterase [uncultured Jatrophihabitans sp.]|uniref:glycerophosphodiester phosphodiesterase n=1 Tax=uncultured Jatrophihabitans sp. TaxID=1610747 RepID=UPI0035CAAAD9